MLFLLNTIFSTYNGLLERNSIISWGRSINNMFIHQFTQWWCFQFRAITNRATMNIHKFFISQALIPQVWWLSCKESGYLSLCESDVPSSRMTIPFTHQQCLSDPVSLHRCQNLVWSVLLVLPFMTVVECYLIVSLIYIP